VGRVSSVRPAPNKTASGTGPRLHRSTSRAPPPAGREDPPAPPHLPSGAPDGGGGGPGHDARLPRFGFGNHSPSPFHLYGAPLFPLSSLLPPPPPLSSPQNTASLLHMVVCGLTAHGRSAGRSHCVSYCPSSPSSAPRCLSSDRLGSSGAWGATPSAAECRRSAGSEGRNESRR
jgi:hypothetical protein